MKETKSRSLLALTLAGLALSSCGGGSRAGLYMFQMGKSSGAHAMASMELFDTDYVYEGKNYGKNMILRGEVQAGPKKTEEQSVSSSLEETSVSESSQTSGETSEQASEEIPFSENAQSILEKGISLPGYYNIAEDRGDGRKHLELGISLDFITSILGEEAPTIHVPPELIEDFIYGEIDNQRIYLQIPVSFTDLQMQLYWYGEDIPWLHLLDGNNVDELLVSLFGDPESTEASGSEESTSIDTGPEPVVHDRGSKPTEEDVEAINEYYSKYHDGLKFRNFYTISLSLARQ